MFACLVLSVKSVPASASAAAAAAAAAVLFLKYYSLNGLLFACLQCRLFQSLPSQTVNTLCRLFFNWNFFKVHIHLIMSYFISSLPFLNLLFFGKLSLLVEPPFISVANAISCTKVNYFYSSKI